MRILYIGSLDEQSNSFRRFETLQSMVDEVNGINVDEYIYQGNFIKLHHHLNAGPGINALNRTLDQVTKEQNPDVLWIDNKSYIKSATFKKIKDFNPGIKIINVVTDDITGKLSYQWRLALKNVNYVDCFFVQRTVNIAELQKHGAKRVELCYRSYDPRFHRSLQLTKAEEKTYKASVGFIGTYESCREEFIAYLIRHNIPVSVTGDGWENKKLWKIIKPWYKGPSVYGEPYVKTINGLDIALHFLRHGNRDEQDSRTFEIPACGSFMLAEKSDLHTALFQAGKEAVFFETREQLLDQVRYFLVNEREREVIAEAGQARCVNSGYTHQHRIARVLATIDQL